MNAVTDLEQLSRVQREFRLRSHAQKRCGLAASSEQDEKPSAGSDESCSSPRTRFKAGGSAMLGKHHIATSVGVKR